MRFRLSSLSDLNRRDLLRIPEKIAKLSSVCRDDAQPSTLLIYPCICRSAGPKVFLQIGSGPLTGVAGYDMVAGSLDQPGSSQHARF
jgi:hypothetical protein